MGKPYAAAALTTVYPGFRGWPGASNWLDSTCTSPESVSPGSGSHVPVTARAFGDTRGSGSPVVRFSESVYVYATASTSPSIGVTLASSSTPWERALPMFWAWKQKFAGSISVDWMRSVKSIRKYVAPSRTRRFQRCCSTPASQLLLSSGFRLGLPNAGHGGKAGKNSSLNVGARNPCPQLALSLWSVCLAGRGRHAAGGLVLEPVAAVVAHAAREEEAVEQSELVLEDEGPRVDGLPLAPLDLAQFGPVLRAERDRVPGK